MAVVRQLTEDDNVAIGRAAAHLRAVIEANCALDEGRISAFSIEFADGPCAAQQHHREGAGRRKALATRRVTLATSGPRPRDPRTIGPDVKKGPRLATQPLELDGSPTWTRTRDLRINRTGESGAGRD